jgi:acetyl-CoA carboxylase biotin carboxylase subunit
MISGVDLVQWQIRVAAGETLPWQQADIQLTGHAMEFRINAENPERGFAPTPGTIERLVLPGGRGVRVDSHVTAGYSIPQYYDSMVAKLIVHGKDRAEAICIARRALQELKLEGKGLATTTPLHLSLLDNAEFVAGTFDTSFLEKFLQT